MPYATDHAAALTDVADAGASITFTDVTQGSYDPETDTATPSTATVTGSAVRVQGDPQMYEALGLVEAEPATLLFAPTTYGDTPALGSTCTWGSSTFTVRAVNPVAPDGSAIIAKVVVSR